MPLERRHDAAGARRAVEEACRLFGNVSADLMIGIPGQTRTTLRQSVDGLLGAGIRHLSVYLLEIEKAPRLVRLRAERPELFADDDEMADRWLEVDERLEASGLPRYEISNWARPGFESRHNLKYWTLAPVLGFGVAAHSFDGRRRSANTGMLMEYLRRTRAGESTTATVEENAGGSDFLRRKERLMLGLRLASGRSLFLIRRNSVLVAGRGGLADWRRIRRRTPGDRRRGGGACRSTGSPHAARACSSRTRSSRSSSRPPRGTPPRCGAGRRRRPGRRGRRSRGPAPCTWACREPARSRRRPSRRRRGRG